MTIAASLLILLLAGPGTRAARAEDAPRVVVKRYASRVGTKIRWFVDGRLAAEGMMAKDGDRYDLVARKGDPPREPATEIDAKGRIIAQWAVCPSGAFTTFKIEEWDDRGRKVYDFQPTVPGVFCPKNGTGRLYYPEGGVKAEIPIRDGVHEGTMVSYYPNGRVKARGTVSNGLFHGKSEEFDAAGHKTAEKIYVNGQLEGVAYQFRPDGGIKQIDHYKGGVLTSSDKL